MTRVQILSTLTHILNLSKTPTDFLEAIYCSTVQHICKCLQDGGPDDHFQMSVCCKESGGTSISGRRNFQGTEFSPRLYHPTISLPGRARAQDKFCQWIWGEANATQPQREPERDKSSAPMHTLKGFPPWDAAGQDGKAEMIYISVVWAVTPVFIKGLIFNRIHRINFRAVFLLSKKDHCSYWIKTVNFSSTLFPWSRYWRIP